MSMLEKDFKDPYDAWKLDPTPTTTGALLKSVDPVIKSAMRSYGGASQQSPTLRTKARKIAVDSFGTYDPVRGTMKSHLMSRMQSLRRVARKEQQIIQMPEQVSLDLFHTHEAGQELEDKLGRPPSDLELADHTGIPVKRLEYIRQSRQPVAEGTVTQRTEEGAGGFDPAVQSLTPDDAAWVELVYTDINPTNQFILERTLGLHGHKKINATQIAQQLRISSGAVSQRMQQIQAKLDQRDELGML
jgi:DNA-directed RNA polymerase specialized sigma subunit